MVGWDGIEPPTPGFSDLPRRLPRTHERLPCVTIRELRDVGPDMLLPDLDGWRRMIRSE